MECGRVKTEMRMKTRKSWETSIHSAYDRPKIMAVPIKLNSVYGQSKWMNFFTDSRFLDRLRNLYSSLNTFKEWRMTKYKLKAVKMGSAKKLKCMTKSRKSSMANRSPEILFLTKASANRITTRAVQAISTIKFGVSLITGRRSCISSYPFDRFTISTWL